MLAKNFGLNTNGDAFLKIAQSIPFALIRKESREPENLEALFFSFAGLLDECADDNYSVDLRFRREYLFRKYNLEATEQAQPQFFKHRPDNFPTVRLSQLASLYHTRQNLFSEVISRETPKAFYELFGVNVNSYWETHYLFDRPSAKKKKELSQTFIRLLLINTIIPINFAYAKSIGKEIGEAVVKFMAELSPENNSVIDKFGILGIKARNAFESQALLQLKNEFCNFQRCMDCAIGTALLKGEPALKSL